MAGKKRKIESESWLYSAILITAVVMFIALKSTPPGSTDQAIAAGVGGLVGLFFSLSNNWRIQPEKVYIWASLLAIVTLFTWVGWTILASQRKK
jgi:hypothetical protein